MPNRIGSDIQLIFLSGLNFWSSTLKSVEYFKQKKILYHELILSDLNFDRKKYYQVAEKLELIIEI